MTVYVDNYRRSFNGMAMSHLMSDASFAELHEFAKRLGMPRRWFQWNSRTPHYDVNSQKRREAIRLGAVHLPIKVDGERNPEWLRVVRAARALKEAAMTPKADR